MKSLCYILSIITLLSCSSKEKKQEDQNGREFDVIGVVLDKFPERNELSIHHNEIPDFMMAMTMNFKLADKLTTDDFEIGDSVHFKLFIKEHSVYSDNFKVIDNVYTWLKFKNKMMGTFWFSKNSLGQRN